MAALTTFRLTDYKFDDTKANPRMPPVGGRPYGGITQGFLSAGGVVKTAKKDGDHVAVAVEKTQVTQMDCVKEHWGNKVIGVDHNGKYVYELICDQEAPVTHDTTYKDFDIAPEYEASLKPGAMFSVLNGAKIYDVVAVWPNKKAKQPSFVLGGAVK